MVSVALRQTALMQLSALSRSAPVLFSRGFASGHSNVVELLSDQEYQTALKDLSAAKESAVIDFTAKWCGPCKMMAPIYDKLSTDHPDIKFYKVDIDNAEVQLALLENSVASVPTFVFYKGADRVGAFSGANREQLQALAMAYAVREHAIAAVPTFVGYKGGERLSAFSGADRTELQKMVQELQAGSA